MLSLRVIHPIVISHLSCHCSNASSQKFLTFRIILNGNSMPLKSRILKSIVFLTGNTLATDNRFLNQLTFFLSFQSNLNAILESRSTGNISSINSSSGAMSYNLFVLTFFGKLPQNIFLYSSIAFTSSHLLI